MKTQFRNILFLLIAVLIVPAAASADVFTLDNAHTSIAFGIKHMGLSTVTGTFDDFQGAIDWDLKNAEKGSVDVTIKAASVNTRIQQRDDHLRKGFFDVAKFDKIIFKSKKVVVTGKDTAKVIGDLTLRGVTKEVTLDVKYLGLVEKDPMGLKRIAFHAETKLNRKDFGVNEAGIPDKVIGDEVQVTIDTEATAK